MEDSVNPEGNGNESGQSIEAAFSSYLEGQDKPSGGEQQQEASQEAGQTELHDESTSTEAEQLYKVKVNGEEREVTLSELVKGYQLESDYRVKTSKLAEQSRAAQDQHAQSQAALQHYARQIQEYQAQLVAMRPQPPDAELISSDPVSFLRQQQAFNAWQQQLQQSERDREMVVAQQQEIDRQGMQASLEREAASLVDAIPEWQDQEKAQSEKSELVTYLNVIGYTKDEIAQAVDHRAIVIARKAMLYDRLVQGQKAAAGKVANLPPRSPQRPGNGATTSPTDGRTRHMQALKKSGSVDDATQVFAAMLGGEK